MGYEVFVRPQVIIACLILTPVYTDTGTGLGHETPLGCGEVRRPLRNMGRQWWHMAAGDQDGREQQEGGTCSTATTIMSGVVAPQLSLVSRKNVESLQPGWV